MLVRGQLFTTSMQGSTIIQCFIRQVGQITPELSARLKEGHSMIYEINTLTTRQPFSLLCEMRGKIHLQISSFLPQKIKKHDVLVLGGPFSKAIQSAFKNRPARIKIPGPLNF